MRGAFFAGCLMVSLLCGGTACSGGTAQSSQVAGDQDGEPRMKFSPAEWTDEAKVYDPPHVRARMIDDVTANILKKGMARAEVVKLLGPATETNKFRDHGLVYFIGPEKGLGVDSRWLLIDFDGDAVRSFSVAND